MTERIAIYAGSFDPLTNGHLDVLKAGAVGLADKYLRGDRHPGPGKTPACSASSERVALIEQARRDEPSGGRWRRKHPALSPSTGSGDRRRARNGASIMIRGLRDGTDLDYEMQMAGMNETMAPELQTVSSAGQSLRCVTLPPHLVRQIASMGGDISPLRAARRSSRIGALSPPQVRGRRAASGE
jgi:pantetheine-phosphate adenylyltransferase